MRILHGYIVEWRTSGTAGNGVKKFYGTKKFNTRLFSRWTSRMSRDCTLRGPFWKL